MIDDALTEAPETLAPQLLAFRVAQLAMAARPAEADALGSSIAPAQLTALPATILACGLAVAFGDLGRPHAATLVAEEGNRRAADSPQAAYQAVALNLVYVDALVLAGCIPDALTLGQRLTRQWADIRECRIPSPPPSTVLLLWPAAIWRTRRGVFGQRSPKPNLKPTTVG